MLSGLHAPNAMFTHVERGPTRIVLNQEVIEAVTAGKFRSVKLMWYHSPAVVPLLRALGVEHFLVRLPNSIADTNYPDTLYEPWVYADVCVSYIRAFRVEGVLDFQMDCEPNITHALIGRSPDQYVDWLLEAISSIWGHRNLPNDVRIGFPPMSMAEKHRPFDWLGPLIEVAPRFGFLCVNSYWQSNRQGRTHILQGPLTWRQFGGACEWYHDWQPDMHIMITEYGNSIHEQTIDGVPVYNPGRMEAFRREQYPIYLEWLAGHPYVESAYVYISPGSTPDWAGFRVSPTVAHAMATAQVDGKAQSQWLGNWKSEI